LPEGDVDDHIALDQLEALAYGLGIEIRYEKIPQDDVTIAGGLYRLKGKNVIVIDSRAKAKDRIRTLVQALKPFDLTDVYIRPALRQMLEKE
jgi:acetyl-CoA carboxylase alpha subunit